MFKGIINFIKKLFKWLLPILIIVLIILAVFFPALLPVIGSYLATAWSAVSGWVGAAFSSVGSWVGTAASAIGSYLQSASIGEVAKLALGAAILIDPESVGEGLGHIAKGLGEGAGSAVSALIGAVPDGLWIAAGVGLLWWLMSGKSDDGVIVVGSAESRNSRPNSVSDRNDETENLEWSRP